MKQLYALCFTFLLISCAGFATQNVTDIGYKHYSPKNISINYHVTVQRKLNYDTTDLYVKTSEDYFSNIISEDLSHPKFFMNISDDNPKADYQLDINIANEGHYNKNLSLVSYCTLGIIPSIADDTFYYDAKLTNNKTKTVKEFRYKENYKKITHLTMLLFAPFKLDEIDHMHKRVMNRISYEVIEHINNPKR